MQTRLLQFIKFIVAPISRYPGTFATIAALFALVPQLTAIYLLCCRMTGWGTAIAEVVSMAAEGILYAWIILLIFRLLHNGLNNTGVPRWLRMISRQISYLVIPIAIFVGIFDFASDLLCLAFTGGFYRPVCNGWLFGTNGTEVSEFMEHYVHIASVFTVVGSVALLFALVLGFKNIVIHARRHPRCHQPLRIAGLCLLTGAFICYPLMAKTQSRQGDIGVKIRTMAEMRQEVALESHDLECTAEADSLPDDIVIIFGESLGRDFMSVYGYDMPTTPNLDSLAADGRLIVFTQPVAAATSTIEAFSRMVTTWQGQDDIDWYSEPNIYDVAHAAGYTTEWYSNQSPNAYFDKVVLPIAYAADRTQFTTEVSEEPVPLPYDEAILDIFDSPAADRRLTLFHLMGQHEKFKARYPADRGHFVAEQYGQYPEHQGKTRAQYDNSIAYNDSIVTAIMARFADKDAMVVYLSDHALDLYASSANYAAHAKKSFPRSVEAGLRIPLVVYTSTQFNQRHPALRRRLEQAASQPFNAEALTDSLAAILSVKL